MAGKESTINSFVKGINQDTPEHLQPEGSYRFALNAVPETSKGELGFLTNELSNENCVSFADNESIVGSCYIGNNESVIFVHRKNLLIDDSIIYIVNHELCTKTEIVSPGLNYLNFNTLHPIQATFRVRNGCERWVYFVDYFNTDKAVNLDAPANYYNSNPKLLEHTLYGDPYTLNLTKINNSGGEIPVGTLQITARYLDRYHNPTEFFGLSLPIPITIQENDFTSIIGGKSGMTNRSAEYQFTNIDTAFSYIEIAVVETTQGISNAYIVDKLPVVSSTLDYLYTGTDRATTKLSSLQELVQQYSPYKISKTLTQKDNRLIKGNLKGPEYDWLCFQRSAMNITSKYVVREKRTQLDTYSANNPFYYFDDKSYMRDEVYAFGIRWVMKDGSKSPVFHIPGRAAITSSTVVTAGNTATTNKYLVRNTVSTNDWDKQLLSVISSGNPTSSQIRKKDVEHLVDYFDNCGSCTFALGSFTLDLLYNDVNNIPNTFEATLSGTSTNLTIDYKETVPSNNAASFTFTTTTNSFTVNKTTPNESDTVEGVITLTYTNGSCTWKKTFTIFIEGDNKDITTSEASVRIQQVTVSGKTGIRITLAEDFFGAPFNTSCQIERWRVYNTAIPDTTPETGYYGSGIMAYTESDSEVYPTITDCSGNSVFGSGNEGQPVRHHKFPDAQVSPFYTGWYATKDTYKQMEELDISMFPLGIKFNNIVPPTKYANAVEYYEIVRCEVDETVLDKGLLTTFRAENYGEGKCDFVMNPNYEGLNTEYTTPNNTIQHSEIISPKALFLKEELNHDHIRLEKIFGFFRYDITNQPVSPGPYNLISQVNVIDGNLTNNLLQNSTFKGSEPIWANRKTIGEYLPKYDSQLLTKNTKIGTTASSQHQIAYFVALQDDVPFTVIANHDSTPTGFNDPYTANNYIQLVSLKKTNFSQYYGLSSLKYIRCQNNLTPAASTTSTAFGGDTFISRMEYLQTFNLNSELKTHVVSTSFTCGSVTEDYYYITRVSFITESRVNTELRTLENNQYFYPYVNLKRGSFLDPWDTTIGYHLDSSGTFQGWKELFYTYNNDYSFSGSVNSYFAPDFTLSCTSCTDYYPNRVIWTNTSEPDDLFDNYRVFRLADFLDVQGHRGSITRIFPEGDYLTIDCERTRFIVSTTRQALQGTTENIYVGLGDYLSNQMREVTNSIVGFLGNQSQFCFENTEYGVVTVDQTAGKVFKTFNNQPEILSNKGLRNWFAENLPSEIEKQYLTLTSDKYPLMDKVGHAAGGVGVISVYDARYERVIISKRDYKITAEGLALLAQSAPNEHIGFDSAGLYYYANSTVGPVPIRQENYPEWFENKSWTISFSMKHDAWVSWHSYLPNYYVHALHSFMSGVNDNTTGGSPTDMYKHNKEHNYQTYYGVFKPHILESVVKSELEPIILKNVRVLSYTEQYDSTTGYYATKPQEFFNKVCVYNSRQTTGDCNLYFVPNHLSGAVVNKANQIPVMYRDNYYNFNQFNDASDNKSPMFSTAWADLQSNYFIDKVVNPNSIVANKSWFNKMMFRDRYHIIRLTHDKSALNKLTTNFVISFNENIYA